MTDTGIPGIVQAAPPYRRLKALLIAMLAVMITIIVTVGLLAIAVFLGMALVAQGSS